MFTLYWLNAWIASKIALFRKKKVAQVAEALPDHRPNLQLCEELLHSLDPNVFDEYKPSVGKLVKIEPMWVNIDIYSKRLREYSRTMEHNKVISVEECDFIEHPMVLDNFFIDSKRHYVYAVSAVEEFKAAGVRFCTALNYVESEAQEINTLRMRRVLLNVQHITQALLKVSMMA